MSSHEPRALSELSDLSPGSHMFLLVEGDLEGEGALLDYLLGGARHGDKLLCLLDLTDPVAFAARLTAAAPELGEALETGRLELGGFEDLCSAGGRFEPVRARAVLEAASERGRAQGCRSLRLAGEMSWISRLGAELEPLRQHQAWVTGFVEEHGAMALCLYERRRFTPARLLEQLRLYPAVVVAGLVHANPYYLPVTDASGAPPEGRALAHVLAHVREQGELTRSLRRSELRYRQLFDSLIHGFSLHEMIFDAAGEPRDYRFVEINPAFEALTGLSGDAVLGRTVLEVIPGLEREWIERYGRVVTTGEETRFRMYSSPLARHYEVVAYRASPGRFATVFSDITEIVEAEEKRREAERRLFESQKLDSLGMLAGGIAHDFNNMLMGVLGNASLALDEVEPGSPLADCLVDIEAAAKNAAGLARQLLAYSGRGRFMVEPVDVASLVQEMAKLLEASIPKSVRLRYQFDPHAGLVEADLSQMRQVLMNLILNAAQAIGGRSGVVTVQVSAMHCDADYLATTFADDQLDEGDYVYLEVSDTGAGMTPEVQLRIFDPFFTTKETGRGLGLAATLGIIRGHRGAIKVYSEVGRGTTFKVLLPQHGGAEPLRPRQERATGGFEAHGTVLVVDDEEQVRRAAGRILERMGFEVLSAEDGREAVAIFRSHADEIVLVLLDMMMPRMGGERTFTELRRIRPEVRVVLSSGYNQQEAVDRFVGRGLAGFIQKPYPKDELERVVREALG